MVRLIDARILFARAGTAGHWCMLLLAGLMVCMLCAVRPAMAQNATAGVDDNTYVHFFVVPATAPEGHAFHEEIIALKKMLIDRAGGFTQLGPSHGGHLRPNGNIERQDNISFVVASTEDMRQELVDFIHKHFNEDQPFVLVTRGWCSLY